MPATLGVPEQTLKVGERPACQQFPYLVIGLFLELVIQAAVSLRGSRAVLAVVQGLLPQIERLPSANGGQMWLLRIGLYEVVRVKEKADDWVWLADHTVQIGTLKCLLIVGCRLAVWQAQARPLEHGDLQVLALEPVATSPGDVVERQLEVLAKQVGVPRQILSDHGSDLKSGIEAFCHQHPETAGSYDIAHKIALVLKRELAGDERWFGYLQALGQTKLRLLQTPLAYLVPPSPKSKARYMNLEQLVAWGQKALTFLEEPPAVGGVPVPAQDLQEKLGWLREYRTALGEWQEVMGVVAKTLTYVRHAGYHRKAKKELAKQLLGVSHTALSRRVATALVAFVAEQSAQARPGERLLGSTECLESLIGKGKRLEGQQSKSGFTKMLLGMAAAVVKPTKEYLSAAFATVKVKDVAAWCQAKLGTSLQAQRCQAFAACPVGTKPG